MSVWELDILYTTSNTTAEVTNRANSIGEADLISIPALNEKFRHYGVAADGGKKQRTRKSFY